MRIAFASDMDKGLESIVSRKFGRSAYFVIVELDDNKNILKVESIKNPASMAAGGAGIKAVQELVNRSVDIAVAGAFGPNAMAALVETGIKYYTISDVSVKEALEKVLSG